MLCHYSVIFDFLRVLPSQNSWRAGNLSDDKATERCQLTLSQELIDKNKNLKTKVFYKVSENTQSNFKAKLKAKLLTVSQFLYWKKGWRVDQLRRKRETDGRVTD